MSINIPTMHEVKISVPFGELQSIIDWCDKNCVGKVKYMENPEIMQNSLLNGTFEHSNDWILYFDSERDYVAFTLWRK